MDNNVCMDRPQCGLWSNWGMLEEVQNHEYNWELV